MANEVRQRRPLRPGQGRPRLPLAANLRRAIGGVREQIGDLKAIVASGLEELLGDSDVETGSPVLDAVSCRARSRRRRSESLIRTDSVCCWALSAIGVLAA